MGSIITKSYTQVIFKPHEAMNNSGQTLYHDTHVSSKVLNPYRYGMNPFVGHVFYVVFI
jgi:hypothetical protein